MSHNYQVQYISYYRNEDYMKSKHTHTHTHTHTPQVVLTKNSILDFSTTAGVPGGAIGGALGGIVRQN